MATGVCRSHNQVHRLQFNGIEHPSHEPTQPPATRALSCAYRLEGVDACTLSPIAGPHRTPGLCARRANAQAIPSDARDIPMATQLNAGRYLLSS
jgi:hypothetical protein